MAPLSTRREVQVGAEVREGRDGPFVILIDVGVGVGVVVGVGRQLKIRVDVL